MENSQLLNRVLRHLSWVNGPNAKGWYTPWCPFHTDGQGMLPCAVRLGYRIIIPKKLQGDFLKGRSREAHRALEQLAGDGNDR